MNANEHLEAYFDTFTSHVAGHVSLSDPDELFITCESPL